MTVLVLSPLYPDDALGGLAVVREPREDVEAILTMPACPVRGDDMDALPGLRVVATGTIGYDHIDVDAAAARVVWVCNVPDYCVEEVADHGHFRWLLPFQAADVHHQGCQPTKARLQHGIERLDVPIREQPGTWARVAIGRDSWVGDRAVVLADVGCHCVIGARCS